MLLVQIAALLLAYLLGSLPVGYLVVKWALGLDLTQMGSGHTGGTNVLRSAGPKAAAVTILFDFAKGLGAVLLAKSLVGPDQSLILALAGMLSVVGHNYSIFLRFKGGVGSMVSLGAGVALMLWSTLSLWALGFAAIAISRYASLGSLTIAIGFPVACLVGILTGCYPPATMIFALGGGGLSVWALRTNAKRLLAGTERKIGQKIKGSQSDVSG